MLDKKGVSKASKLALWLWSALGLVLVLLCAPFLVGSFLKGPFVGEASLVLPLAREDLWRAIDDHVRFPISGALAREMRLLSTGNDMPIWVEEQLNATLRVETLESVAPERLALRVTEDPVALESRWDIRLEERGAETVVRVVQSCEVRAEGWRAPQLRFVMKFMGGARMGPQGYLRRLAEGLGYPARSE